MGGDPLRGGGDGLLPETLRKWIERAERDGDSGAILLAHRSEDLDMIRHYLDRALRRARYTPLEDGSYCAEVRGLRGVIGTGATIEACREDLESVIEEWILMRVARGLSVPALDGVKIRISKAS